MGNTHNQKLSADMEGEILKAWGADVSLVF